MKAQACSGSWAPRKLPRIDRETPKGKTLHLVANNYAKHKRRAPRRPEAHAGMRTGKLM